MLPHHLIDLIGSTSQRDTINLIKTITSFTNLVLAGRSLYCCTAWASLVALNKNIWGVRAIGVGCTLRYLLAKISYMTMRQSLSKLLDPYQLGYCTKLGADAISHASRIYLGSIQPGHIFLNLDFRKCLQHDPSSENACSYRGICL